MELFSCKTCNVTSEEGRLVHWGQICHGGKTSSEGADRTKRGSRGLDDNDSGFHLMVNLMISMVWTFSPSSSPISQQKKKKKSSNLHPVSSSSVTGCLWIHQWFNSSEIQCNATHASHDLIWFWIFRSDSVYNNWHNMWNNVFSLVMQQHVDGSTQFNTHTLAR